MSYRRLIAEDRNLITYRPSLRSIGGSVVGTILLQQIIYWDTKADGKFFKFIESCDHEMYKSGDSFCEELGMSAKEIRTGLSHFAFKCGKKNREKYGEHYEEQKTNSLVTYYTDSNRVTWYMLNRDLLYKLLMGVYKENDQQEFINHSSTETTTEIPLPPTGQDREILESAEKETTESCSSATSPDLRSLKKKEKEDRFAEFWEAYPRKQGKADALKAFVASKNLPTNEKLIEKINANIKSGMWKVDEKNFIPLAGSWIRGERWDDETIVRAEEATKAERVCTEPISGRKDAGRIYFIDKPLPDGHMNSTVSVEDFKNNIASGKWINEGRYSEWKNKK